MEFSMELMQTITNNGIEVTKSVVNKNGVNKTAYSFKRAGQKTNLSPTVYDDFFERFDDVDSMVENVIEMLDDTERRGQFDLSFFTRENIMKNCLLRVRKRVNNGNARKYVADVQTEVYIPVGTFGDGMGTVTIKNDHIKQLKINKEELFKTAAEHTIRNIEAKGMLQIMLGVESDLEDEEMIVVTNKEKLNAAAALALPDFFYVLSRRIDKTEFYILPSSIHELIVVNRDEVTLGELQFMVKNVNETEVDPEERLSDSVYLYNAITNKITVAA